MWSRVVEIMLGCWMAMSPFIFRHPESERGLWINDFACAAIIAAFAGLSYVPRLREAHLVLVAVALWMIAFGWASSDPPALPGYQNDIAVGLLLLMLSIIPSHNETPPRAWQTFDPAGPE